jgi:hypothetical protein
MKVINVKTIMKIEMKAENIDTDMKVEAELIIYTSVSIVTTI